MTAIWHNDKSAWRLLTPSGFPTEAELHDLVEEAPHTLPLAGDPQLLVVGREVALGGNRVDLIAIEPTGQLAVIEIKLAINAEARRAVIAQILTYAASLHGLDTVTLEQVILKSHLASRGATTLAQVVQQADQIDAFDADAFQGGLSACLREGWFRLVLVLDTVPPELVRLVGYLQTVADKLTIDLITVAAYDIAGSRIIVPQRVESEHPAAQPAPAGVGASQVTQSNGLSTPGADAFIATIETSPEPHREHLRRLADWAITLEREGLVTLTTYQGVSGRWSLLPRLLSDKVGLVTIWNNGGAHFQLWRSVFERRAPQALPQVEALIAPDKVGQGTVVRLHSDAVLEALTAAYREAAQASLQPSSNASPLQGNEDG